MEQEASKATKATAWYQVPVLWLCLLIFLLTLLACAHLIMVSLEADKEAADPAREQAVLMQNKVS